MIVVDSSAVIDALTGIGGTDELRGLLATEELHAPTLLDFEIVSALRGLTLGGHVSQARAQDVLIDFEDLQIERWPSTHPLRIRSFHLRTNVSAYDAAYLALAEALECPLVTRDARLARTSGHDAHILVR